MERAYLAGRAPGSGDLLSQEGDLEGIPHGQPALDGPPSSPEASFLLVSRSHLMEQWLLFPPAAFLPFASQSTCLPVPLLNGSVGMEVEILLPSLMLTTVHLSTPLSAHPLIQRVSEQLSYRSWH